MPIYMDRHNLAGVSAEDAAHAHDADLAIQATYDVDFLTYWFDAHRGAVFCLVEAPDREAVEVVHREAHGLIPHDIIEVDLKDVNAFLGRIRDPQPDAEGNVVMDSAFRSVMFTDLKGSTQMSRNLGDTLAMKLLEQHDAIICQAVGESGGVLVKHTGDGVMASFCSVPDTVACAIKIQRGFQSFRAMEPATPLHVRIGINPGEPFIRRNDLFGVTVQLAARICDQSPDDEILVSGVVPPLCAETTDYQFLDGGKALFKGFEHAIQLYKVVWH